MKTVRTFTGATLFLAFAVAVVPVPASGQTARGRTVAGPRVGVAVARPMGSRPLYRSYYRPMYRSYYHPFYRPYYAFRPRFSVGFGLWVGYPIAYPYAYYGYPNPYYYPYAYANPYPYYSPYSYPTYNYPAPSYPPPAYGQQPYGSAQVAPGAGATNTVTGGVSFEITPVSAGVYVDGSYVGTVGTFTPASPPLALTPGRHRLELRAPGYETMTLDVDVVAGQVVPYQGQMQPVR